MSAPETPGRVAPVARGLMWAGVVVVAGAAAVLSFAALRDLALMCGFGRRLAWLLPVAIDVGTALGSLVWLGRWTPGPARRYARGLALALLGGSVAGNALGHGLVAYGARPHWLVVVAVSAVAPAVLGAVVHLAVLATHTLAAAVADQVDHGPAQVDHYPDHYPDQARPGTDQADQHPDRDAPAATELLAELDVPGWVEAGWSGEVDQHPDQSGPGADQARTAVPNQSADDPILAADLRRWAADQVGSAVAERGDEPLRDRHDPRQPAIRRPTPVRHRIRGGPRTGPRRTSSGPHRPVP